MKRFILILLSLILTLSLCACKGNDSETVVQDGQKLAGKGAGNEAVGYTFAYPEEWELSENNGVIAIRLDCNPSDAIAEYASINVIAFSLKGSEFNNAKSYWESYEKDIQETFGDYKLLDTNEELKVADCPTVKVKYSATTNGRSYIFEQVMVYTYSDVYIITLTVAGSSEDAEDYDIAAPGLKAVYESFKFE